VTNARTKIEQASANTTKLSKSTLVTIYINLSTG